MAQGDFTLFSPGEQTFQNPGQFEASMKAEGVRKAAATTELDKFYSQLNESQRQFDIGVELQKGSLGLQERALDLEEAGMEEGARQFDETLGFQTEQSTLQRAQELEMFAQTMGLEGARLAEEGRQFDKSHGLKASELVIQENLSGAQAALFGAQAGLAKADTKSSGISDTLAILGLGLGGSRLLFGSEKTGGLDLDLDFGGSLEGLGALGASNEIQDSGDIPWWDDLDVDLDYENWNFEDIDFG
jgi:hypothetical protein